MMENFQYYAPTKVVFGKVRKIKQDSLSKSKTAGRCLFITGAEV